MTGTTKTCKIVNAEEKTGERQRRQESEKKTRSFFILILHVLGLYIIAEGKKPFTHLNSLAYELNLLLKNIKNTKYRNIIVGLISLVSSGSNLIMYDNISSIYYLVINVVLYVATAIGLFFYRRENPPGGDDPKSRFNSQNLVYFYIFCLLLTSVVGPFLFDQSPNSEYLVDFAVFWLLFCIWFLPLSLGNSLKDHSKDIYKKLYILAIYFYFMVRAITISLGYSKGGSSGGSSKTPSSGRQGSAKRRNRRGNNKRKDFFGSVGLVALGAFMAVLALYYKNHYVDNQFLS